MYKLLPFLLLINLLFGDHPAIKGYVRNGDIPLANSIIVHQSTGTWTVSNEYGYFSSAGSVGDTISVYHYGYKQYKTEISHESPIIIQLDQNPLKMKTVHVIGENNKMQVSHFQVKPGRNLSSTLRLIPSIMLRTYGGPGGLSTVSFDGSLSTHTKIIWNGIDLTSPQNGMTDLSQIPIAFINQISIGRTPALSYGSGSIDGSIEIQSSKPSIIDFSTGSFGTQSIAARTRFGINGGSASVGIGQYKSDGDFAYSHNNNSGIRKNNTFSQSFYSFESSHAITEQWFVLLQTLVTNQNRGIPGLVFSPSPKAGRQDDLLLSKFKSLWQIPNHLFSLSVTSRKSDEHYINPRYAVDSNHSLSTSQLELGWATNPLTFIEIDQNIAIKKESISSTNTNSNSRIIQTYTHTIRWRLSQNLSNETGFRFDTGIGDFNVWTWQSGIEYLVNNSSISLTGGNGFRYPTFNDLYWEPGGNASLLPEKTNWARIHLNTQLKDHQLSVQLSSKQSRNLIQWVPGESYWQPQNIAKTRRNTLTFTFGGRLIKIINFTTNFTMNESISINEKKPMLYAPKYIGSISLETNLHHINGWVNGQYMGERITMYSWPMDVKMNPYMVLTCGINYTINPNITVLFSINNLLNNNYMTVNGYPEPGRSFSLSIQYKPKNKKKKS